MADRERIDVDVLFVGAGPASLAGAIHLRRLLTAAGRDATIAIIEKGGEIGAHSLSGAIVDPRAFGELFPQELAQREIPFESPVTSERMLYLTRRRAFPFPWIPPAMSHHGCFVSSLGKLVRWLGRQCEKEGVDIFCGFAGSELLYEDDRVSGVLIGDRGVDKHGQPKPNYEPGAEIRAKVTILGEGTRGSLAKKLIARHGLDRGRNPQVWAVGVKELWQMPPGRVPAGFVAHTMGFPLGHHIFGGGFLYGMADDIWDVGIVVGLDYSDPFIDPHHELQRLKSHPRFRALLQGGELIAYGAKSLPEGGYFSLPKLAVGGAMIIGDAAGFLNGQRLKGIHLAMKSGMLAAETAAAALEAGNSSVGFLSHYEKSVESSWVREELFQVRNFHQAFHGGLVAGLLNSGLGLATGGRGWGLVNRLESTSGHAHLKKGFATAGQGRYSEIKWDGKYIVDKVTDVYHSATAHGEDQVPHLHVLDPSICAGRCAVEFGNPCKHFCPAEVYEMVGEGADRKLQINFSNCVHCKTCDIMDPYQIIDWVPPEGGEGPAWVNL